MQNSQNVDPKQLANLLKKLKIDSNTAQAPDLEQTVQKNLTPEQAALFRSVIADEKKTQQILNSPQAKKIMNLLFKEK
ncbi:MAG: hypothetical protein ACLU8W_07480 [Clostridia bacterium]